MALCAGLLDLLWAFDLEIGQAKLSIMSTDYKSHCSKRFYRVHCVACESQQRPRCRAHVIDTEGRLVRWSEDVRFRSYCNAVGDSAPCS